MQVVQWINTHGAVLETRTREMRNEWLKRAALAISAQSPEASLASFLQIASTLDPEQKQLVAEAMKVLRN